jgi:osmotically-inducible protein OsmY
MTAFTKRIVVVWIMMLALLLLPGCLGEIWTGVSLVYDRHNIYKQVSDFQLDAEIGRALYNDQTFKGKNCSLDYAVFNGDVLIVGYVPDDASRQEVNKRMKKVQGVRRYFFQVSVGSPMDNGLEDDWITAKIRSQIFADSSINPKAFKVVTFNRVIYLMGDVFPVEANRVIHFARSCSGVRRVVKLFKYYTLTDKPL